MIVLLYAFFLFFFSLYSYALIDPNITFVQSDVWVGFRNALVDLGYYHRDVSWVLYVLAIILLFFFSYRLVRNSKKLDPLWLSFMIGVICFFSYPFLSHDFFNYMFDAKIVTFYHQNPYVFKALDFPQDQWIRFMHWTHRTYPYGPVFLAVTLVPSFLSLGKFILSFFLFKATFIGFYILSVYVLQRLNRKWALLFATHPLIIVEGLINGHNDLIGVALAIVGIFFLFTKREKTGRVILFMSLGVKYITSPLLLLSNKEKVLQAVAVGGFAVVLLYLTFISEIQPWYFLNVFALIPFYDRFISKLNIFFFGLLVSYYPYIRLGGWDKVENIQLKHYIIIVFFMIGVLALLIGRMNKRYV